MRWMLGGLMVLSLSACDGGSESGESETDGGSSTGTTSPSSTSDADPSTSSSDPTPTTATPTTDVPTTGETTAGSDASSTTDEPDTDTGSGGPVEDDVPVVVAVGATHARYVSLDDGLTWCQTGRTDDPAGQDFDTPFLLRNVSYGNGLFVAGSWRAIFVSENGLQWEDITDGQGPEFGQWTAQIQYGDGWWVATGGYGTAMRSQDLATWEVTSAGLPGNEASRTLAFGNGMFVTARDGVGWFSSPDGAQWTSMNPKGGTGVIFDGSDFVPHPGYDESATGTRLRGSWPDGIERAEGEGAFERVATVDDTVTRIAFGFTSDASIAGAEVSEELAACLGL